MYFRDEKSEEISSSILRSISQLSRSEEKRDREGVRTVMSGKYVKVLEDTKVSGTGVDRVETVTVWRRRLLGLQSPRGEVLGP